MKLATLVRSTAPAGSPWQLTLSPPGKRELIAPGVWLIRTKTWLHADVFDTHAGLPGPEVDPDQVRTASWYVPSWHDMALCAGLPFAEFFGAANDERPTMKRSELAAARRICAGCPVKQECLASSLTMGERFGVWGGTSGRQRARMRAAMHAGASQAAVMEDWFGRWLTT